MSQSEHGSSQPVALELTKQGYSRLRIVVIESLLAISGPGYSHNTWTKKRGHLRFTLVRATRNTERPSASRGLPRVHNSMASLTLA
jgi:hypothetical protein